MEINFLTFGGFGFVLLQDSIAYQDTWKYYNYRTHLINDIEWNI